MRIIRNAIIFFGIIILCYIAYLWKQTSDVEKICSQYVVGNAPPDIADIKRNYFADAHGPLPIVVKGDLVSEKYFFCSAATFCDISCTVEVSNGKVISSEYFGAYYREEQMRKNMGASNFDSEYAVKP